VKSNEELYNLLLPYKNGNRNSFVTFYNETKQNVFYNIVAYVKDYDVAEDLLQETYVTFLRKINKINKKESILGYLMVISKNLSLDYLKKNKEVLVEESDLDNKSPLTDDLESLNNKDLLNYIKKSLDDDEFKILINHLVNEETFSEIAKKSKIPLGTVEWKYNSALEKLKKKGTEFNG